MQIRRVKECTVADLQERAEALVVACGYEHRSQAVSQVIGSSANHRYALSFKEHATKLARPENEQFFRERGFTLYTVGTEDSVLVQSIANQAILAAVETQKAVAFDISTMTRSWHGAIVRQLRAAQLDSELETFFAYAPSMFMPPSTAQIQNEFVSPVSGFASLSTPDMPVAAIIGLGYEKDGALGLQQLLDPALTVVLVPNSGEGDLYFPIVQRNNRELLTRTPSEWIFEYSISQPGSTFAMLASIIGGIRQSYRIVLASLGPKIFGMVCFLLATRFPDVSVWRISSGVHGHPRDSYGDSSRVVVLDVVWEP